MSRLASFALFTVICIYAAEAILGNCRTRRETAFCTINGVRVQYDKCLQICCNNELHERDATTGCCGPEDSGKIYNKLTTTCCAGVETTKEDGTLCCGNEVFGELYDEATELCCAFHSTQSAKVHDLATNKGCCGTQPIVREGNNNNQCCIDWVTGDMQEFDDRVEMCCHGKVGRVPTTAYGECCHDIAYSRTDASCPCGNGLILNVTREFTACCAPHNGIKEPYVVETDGCCEGRRFNKELQFCCGPKGLKVVGDYSTHYCCNEQLINKTASQDGESLGCCEINGATQTYDATLEICCGGNTLHDISLGDSCCGDQPYFLGSQNCCNDTLFDPETSGSGCCNNAPFDDSESVCCGAEPQGPFQIPACCVDQGFDSYTNTCCGVTVFPNPLMGLDVSHHTRCCGDFSNQNTLFPYDYLTQTCCNETIVELNGVSWDNHGCCGEAPFDRETNICCGGKIEAKSSPSIQCCGDNFLYDETNEICCDGVNYTRVHGENSQCCGGQVMHNEDNLCCNGNVVDSNEFPDTECCGDVGIDADNFKCCEGEARSLDGVDKSSAVCCGQGCIDGDTYWCCDGKAYYKGANDGEVLASLNCNEFQRP